MKAVRVHSQLIALCPEVLKLIVTYLTRDLNVYLLMVLSQSARCFSRYDPSCQCCYSELQKVKRELGFRVLDLAGYKDSSYCFEYLARLMRSTTDKEELGCFSYRLVTTSMTMSCWCHFFRQFAKAVFCDQADKKDDFLLELDIKFCPKTGFLGILSDVFNILCSPQDVLGIHFLDKTTFLFVVVVHDEATAPTVISRILNLVKQSTRCNWSHKRPVVSELHLLHNAQFDYAQFRKYREGTYFYNTGQMLVSSGNFHCVTGRIGKKGRLLHKGTPVTSVQTDQRSTIAVFLLSADQKT
jgi:hypothetical protein